MILATRSPRRHIAESLQLVISLYNNERSFTVTNSTISKNSAQKGGGIYSSTSTVTFDGADLDIKSNEAHLPYPSELSWYQGWGVYLNSGTPITTGGFDPITQVTDNKHI
jgi:predicted outer membrane repeat protein